MKKIAGLVLAFAVITGGMFTSCSKDSGGKKTIGVAMPTKASERWINDGANIKKQLESKGYIVNLEYADDDIDLQITQIENFIEQDVNCLVVAAIDSLALVDTLSNAEAKGIPVIAYDRLLMGTSAISYYATFDNKGSGKIFGKYIEEKKSLRTAEKDGRSYTIEFFMGSPDDNNAVFLYNGVMEVLKPYLESGVLRCKSGKTSFEETCILRWSQKTAQERCEKYLAEYYADEQLDIACAAFDGFSYGIKSALEKAGYDSVSWPLLTGQDTELLAAKNILNGTQTMSIYKDTRLLAEKCVTMVDALLKGSEPEINDTEQYYNGVKNVPSYLCTPVAVDLSNFNKVIIQSGYYSPEDLDL